MGVWFFYITIQKLDVFQANGQTGSDSCFARSSFSACNRCNYLSSTTFTPLKYHSLDMPFDSRVPLLDEEQ